MTDPKLGDASGGHHDPLSSVSNTASEAEERHLSDVWAHVPNVDPLDTPESGSRYSSRSRRRSASRRPLAIWGMGVVAVFALVVAVIVINGRRHANDSASEEVAEWTTPDGANDAFGQLPGQWQSPVSASGAWSNPSQGPSSVAAQSSPAAPWQQGAQPEGVAGEYPQISAGAPQPWAARQNELTNWGGQAARTDAVSAQGWGTTGAQRAGSPTTDPSRPSGVGAYPPATATPPLWQQTAAAGSRPSEMTPAGSGQQTGAPGDVCSHNGEPMSPSGQPASYARQQYPSEKALPSSAGSYGGVPTNTLSAAGMPVGSASGPAAPASDQAIDTWSNAAATGAQTGGQPTYPVAGQSQIRSALVGGNSSARSTSAGATGMQFPRDDYRNHQQNTAISRIAGADRSMPDSRSYGNNNQWNAPGQSGSVGSASQQMSQQTAIAGYRPTRSPAVDRSPVGQPGAMRVTTVWPPSSADSRSTTPAANGVQSRPIGSGAAAYRTADTRAAAGYGATGRGVGSQAKSTLPQVGNWPTGTVPAPNGSPTYGSNQAARSTGGTSWTPPSNSGAATGAGSSMSRTVGQGDYRYQPQQSGANNTPPAWQQGTGAQPSRVLRTSNPWYPGNTGTQQQATGGSVSPGAYNPAPTSYAPMTAGQNAWQ